MICIYSTFLWPYFLHGTMALYLFSLFTNTINYIFSFYEKITCFLLTNLSVLSHCDLSEMKGFKYRKWNYTYLFGNTKRQLWQNLNLSKIVSDFEKRLIKGFIAYSAIWRKSECCLWATLAGFRRLGCKKEHTFSFWKQKSSLLCAVSVFLHGLFVHPLL